MLRKIWNTLRHGDSRTKGFLLTVAGLILLTIVLFAVALGTQSLVPGLTAVVTTIIAAAMAKNAVLIVKNEETAKKRQGKNKKSTDTAIEDKSESREEEKLYVEELEEFGEDFGKKKSRKKRKKEEQEEKERLIREREDEEDFGDNALLSMTEEKLKRLLTRYKVKQEHVPVMIDLCIPERIKQAPGFAWVEGSMFKVLLIERKTRMIERPLSALQEMVVERGIAVKASAEYVELRDSDMMKKVFSPYLPRYQKKEIGGRTVLLKNLYVLDEDIKFTSPSVNELKKLFSFRIEIDDRRLQGENISPFYKDAFIKTFLWKDGLLSLREYKEEIEQIITSMASPAVPYGEFETTLTAMITSGLLPIEYRTFANAKREALENGAKEEKGKKRRK